MFERQIDFARRLGVNKSTITRGVQAGRILLDARGLVDVERSLDRWAETKGGRSDVAARHAAARQPTQLNGPPARKTIALALGHQTTADTAPVAANLAGQAQPNATGPNNPNNPANPDTGPDKSRTRHKAAGIHYDNQTGIVQLAVEEAQRFRRIAVERVFLSLGGAARSSLERLVDQNAARLTPLPDQLARRRLIDHERARTHRLINAEYPRAARRLLKDCEEQSKTEGAEA